MAIGSVVGRRSMVILGAGLLIVGCGMAAGSPSASVPVATPAAASPTESGTASASPAGGGDDYSRGGSGSSSEPTAAGGPAAVSIAGFAFSPATLTVPVGTTVTWTNSDTAPHTVTADGAEFASERLAVGETFSTAFPEPGTFDYHCAVHPRMVGSVVVTP